MWKPIDLIFAFIFVQSSILWHSLWLEHWVCRFYFRWCLSTARLHDLLLCSLVDSSESDEFVLEKCIYILFQTILNWTKMPDWIFAMLHFGLCSALRCFGIAKRHCVSFNLINWIHHQVNCSHFRCWLCTVRRDRTRRWKSITIFIS